MYGLKQDSYGKTLFASGAYYSMFSALLRQFDDGSAVFAASVPGCADVAASVFEKYQFRFQRMPEFQEFFVFPASGGDVSGKHAEQGVYEAEGHENSPDDVGKKHIGDQ